MSNIIDFTNPTVNLKLPTGREKASMIKALIKELTKNINTIEDIAVFIKTKQNDRIMYHSDCSLEDKSVFLQLMQNEIFNELNYSEEDYDDED